jgi:hypothetical protein
LVQRRRREAEARLVADLEQAVEFPHPRERKGRDDDD